MLSDEKRRARNKRKADSKRKAAPRVVSFDAFRRNRFESELRACVQPFYEVEPSRSVLRSMRQVIKKTIRKFARRSRLARLIAVLVSFEGESNTLLIRYIRDGREVQPCDLYVAITHPEQLKT